MISFIGYAYCMFKIIKCAVLDAGVQQGGGQLWNVEFLQLNLDGRNSW